VTGPLDNRVVRRLTRGRHHLDELRLQVPELEEAAVENDRLAVALEAQVDELEHQVMALVELRLAATSPAPAPEEV
jgi:uncharacterized protein YigA (DUF484 family)